MQITTKQVFSSCNCCAYDENIFPNMIAIKRYKIFPKHKLPLSVICSEYGKPGLARFNRENSPLWS